MFCPFVPHCSKSVHSQVTYHSSSCVKVASRPPVAGVCGHVCPVPGTSWYATSIMSGTRCVPVRPGTWYELTKCTQEYVHYPYITSLLHFALFMLLLRTSTSTRYVTFTRNPHTTSTDCCTYLVYTYVLFVVPCRRQSGVVTLQMANPKANALGFKLVSEVSFLYPFLGRILLYLVCESEMQMAQFSTKAQAQTRYSSMIKHTRYVPVSNYTYYVYE